MSLAKDVTIEHAGMTPNPVAVNGAYLVQIEASEIPHIWNDWASSTWASVTGLQWGA